MTNSGMRADPIGAVICSRTGCSATATCGLLWNNSKIHTAERRKVWLACDEHREYLSDYLSARGFLKHVVPVDELERNHGA
jgi:hypothetical protein